MLCVHSAVVRSSSFPSIRSLSMVVKALTLAPKIAHFVASSSSWSIASKLHTRKTSRSVPLPPSALLTPAHLEMVHRNGVKTSDSPDNLELHFPRRLISHETPQTQRYDIPICGPTVNVLHSLYGFLSTCCDVLQPYKGPGDNYLHHPVIRFLDGEGVRGHSEGNPDAYLS